LDGFAGSGAVGIEALSRGARHVVFNDRERLACQIVQENLQRCNLSTGFSIHRRDTFALLRDPPPVPEERALSVLFLDPPYDFGRYRKLLAKALMSPLVDKKTLLILEIFKKTKLDFLPDGVSEIKTLKGGDSHLLFLVCQ
jgi:16S rRNA (guanine966-N2)-methyltransferase